MAQYPFIYHRVVRFQDTDAAGVVYFANLLSMCHEAYEAWLGAIGVNLREFFSGNFREKSREKSSQEIVALPIVHAAADFLQPMFCGETYAIHLTPVQLTESKFQISYAIFTKLGDRPVGQAITIHVCIDPHTRTRSLLPLEISQQLQQQATE